MWLQILSLGMGGQGRDLDGRGRCRETARGVWAGVDESRVLNAFAALHGQDGFSKLQGVGAAKKPGPALAPPLGRWQRPRAGRLPASPPSTVLAAAAVAAGTLLGELAASWLCS